MQKWKFLKIFKLRISKQISPLMKSKKFVSLKADEKNPTAPLGGTHGSGKKTARYSATKFEPSQLKL